MYGGRREGFEVVYKGRESEGEGVTKWGRYDMKMLARHIGGRETPTGCGLQTWHGAAKGGDNTDGGAASQTCPKPGSRVLFARSLDRSIGRGRAA